MKCICSQRDLKEALIAASKALPSGKPQAPILSGIYFVTRTNYLEMHATDFTTGIISKIPAEIEVEGEMVVNGKNITEIVGKLSGSVVTISTEEENNTATIKSDATTFSLYTMEPEDFPKVAMQEYHHSFYIKNDILKNLVNRSVFAVSDDDSRPVFTGCSITVEGENITFVATNTHRLIVIKSVIENNIEGEHSLIVPADALSDVLSIVQAVRDERGVKIEFSDKHIAFTINNMIVACRLIDGTFPAYDRVIPESCKTYANVEVKNFVESLNRVAIIAKQTEYNTARMGLSDEGLELSADSYATGKVVEHLSADVEGPDVEIAFNLRYLQDFLRTSSGNDILRIGVNDSSTPAEFRLADEDNIIYVVTPVRV